MPRSRYLQHVTLDTGHVRRSPRSEVEAETIPAVSRLLSLALAGDEAWIPAVEPRCRLTAAASGRCLVATVWGPDAGEQRVPLATLGVAGRSTCGSRLWRRLHDGRPAEMPALKTDAARVPPEPWCAVRLEPGLALHPEAAEWLGDLERCLAWAWLEWRMGK